MICKYCNTPLPDDAAFCTNCGQKVEKAAPAPAPAPTACAACGAELAPGAAFCTSCGTAVAAPKAAKAPMQLKLSKKGILGIIAGAAGALLIGLIILLICLLSGNSEEDAIDLYFQASCYADVDAALECYPEEFMDALMEAQDMKKSDLKEELKDELEEAEDEYGDFVRYEFEIVDEDEIDEEDIEYYVEMIEEYYDVKLKVTAAKEVEIEYVIEFEDDEIEDEAVFVLVEVDGSWYIFQADSILY